METSVKKLNYETIDEETIKDAGRIIQEGGLVAFPTETVYGLGGDALNPESSVKKLNYETIDEETIKDAGRIIQEGGLVAFPTETVYGLGGDALNPESSRKIYAAKGRPSDNPLIVHIADRKDLYRIADRVTEKAEKLMDAFWPGPLTMIFPKKDLVPCATTGGLDTVAVRMPIADRVTEKAEKLMDAFWPGPLTMIFPKKDLVPCATTGGLDTVAVRMPSDRIAAAFIRAAGGFVAAPSANVSGRPSTTTAAHVEEDLSGRIEMILDGGQAVIGLESTIIDMSVEPPVILRPGAVTKEMMEEEIGPLETDRAILDPNSGIRPKAPGMKYRHYAPRADLTIVEGETKAVTAQINAFAEEARRQGKRVGIIATDETADCYPEGVVMSLGARKNEEEIAMHLFAVLRRFDDTDVDCIYSESFEDAKIGPAIMNRLLKAAGHKVIRA